MKYIVYDKNSFTGINLSSGSSYNNVLECDGYMATVSKNATTSYHGFLTKYPKTTAVGDTIGTSISRGLFMFVPSTYGVSDTKKFLQGFNDGTVRHLNAANAWTTVTSGFSIYFPYDFEQYTPADRVFYSDGKAAVHKWKTTWAASVALHDKSATATNIAGATLTWALSTSVTSDADISASVTAGDWIRKSSTSIYWDEVESVAAGGLTITLCETSLETGAGGAGTSQKATTTTVRGRFLKVWKNRMFIAGGDISGMPIVGTATGGAAGTPLP